MDSTTSLSSQANDFFSPTFFFSLIGFVLFFYHAQVLYTMPVFLLSGVTVIGYLIIRQNDLIYIPGSIGSDQDSKLTPKSLSGMNYESIRIPVVPDECVHCWWIKQHEDDESCQNSSTLLYFHGNAGSIIDRLPYFHELYHRLKLNILAVDYRGYGKSDGRIGDYPEASIRADASAVLKYAVNNIPGVDRSKIFIFGRSLGGAVAIDLAHDDTTESIRGCIVENTFLSMADMILYLFPFLYIAWPLLVHPILKSEWRSKKKIGSIACPLLFISGMKDSLVPPEHMKQLFRMSTKTPFTRFLAVPNGMHNDTPFQAGNSYYEAIGGFISDVLSGTVPSSNKPPIRRDTMFSEASLVSETDDLAFF